MSTVTDVGNLDARQNMASEASKYGAAWTFTSLCAGYRDVPATAACGHGGTATGRGDDGSSTVQAPPPAVGRTQRCLCCTEGHIDSGTHPCSGELTTFEGLFL